MNEILEEINRREPAFLSRDGKGKGFVCPNCGSGSGPKGTGLHRDPGNPTHWKCFACGGYYDTLDLYGLAFGFEDFPQKLSGAATYFGLTAPTPIKAKKKLCQNAPQSPETDCTAFFKAAQARLNETDYPQRRGLSASTCARFGLGYDPQWKNPKAPDSVPASPRLIIPTGKTSYLARDVRSQNELTDQAAKYTKVKVGKTRLFNAEAIDTAAKPVYIVEGEIDAMSIVEAGGEAVALGSASNVHLLMERIREHRPAQPLILALDNDERGQKASAELEEALKAESVMYFVYNPCGEAKDANEALQMAPESFLRRVGDGERLPEMERLSYLQTSAQGHLAAFIDGIAKSVDTPCLPTGFKALDEALDGGLYEGLYIVGAISSLGKTTLVTQIGDQVAAGGHDVLIFSLEMARNELMAKSLSRHTLELALAGRMGTIYAKTARGITDGMRYAHYGDREREIIRQAVAQYAGYAGRIFIEEGVGDTDVTRIRERIARHIDLTGNTPVVIVDYLQIIAPYNERATDKQNMDKTVLELKRISRDFKLPMVAVSSLNRMSYGQKISMEAFKESGAIEYSSDVLIGLQLRGAGEAGFDPTEAKKKNPREIEAVILKHRNGQVGGKIAFEYYPMFNFFKEK